MKKFLLYILLSLSFNLYSQTIDTDIKNFFNSGCSDSTLMEHFQDNTITDIEGFNYTLTFEEFRDIINPILLKYSPLEYDYKIVYPNIYIVNAISKKIKIVFVFELSDNKLIDIIHIEKKKK